MSAPNATTPSRFLILGATSGIAAAVGRRLAARGATLYLVARNSSRLDAVAADLRTRGAIIAGAEAVDLDNTAAHPALLANAVRALGGLDVALLAHGVLGDSASLDADPATAVAMLQTNTVSPISLCTWLANFFAQQRTGTLAVISSVAGDRGRRANVVYGASKSGLSTYLDGLRHRLVGSGVSVLTIKPGPVRTPMTAHIKGYARFADPADVATDILKAIDHRSNGTLYTPAIWRPIMLIVRHIPTFIFNKLNF